MIRPCSRMGLRLATPRRGATSAALIAGAGSAEEDGGHEDVRVETILTERRGPSRWRVPGQSPFAAESKVDHPLNLPINVG
jgi:hypothetical protein